jgi:hypothetical protein
MTVKYDELKDYLESIGGLKCPKWRLDDSGENFIIITDPYFFEIESGWYGLIKNMIAELIEAGWDKEIHQVKQKFGTLRFYTGGATDKMYEIIREYERLSAVTCEVCGEPGEIRSGGWIETLCETHFEQRSV